MTNRTLDRFQDALATGKRPPGYRADAEDAAIVRAAVTMRAARPADDVAREGDVVLQIEASHARAQRSLIAP